MYRLNTRVVWLGIPPLFGLLALYLGMDGNWDLRNYHYYNAYAWLHGRWGWDFLPSQTPSFYNPTLDLGWYWLTEHFSARSIGFILGTLQGLNVIPLFYLARVVCEPAGKTRDLWALLLALTGMLGAHTISEYGTVFHDNLVSLGILSGLALLVCHWSSLWAVGRQFILPTALAGLSFGLAFGLKQSTAFYAVAACAALLISPGPWWPLRRVWLAFSFGCGVLLGIAIGGGHWMWHLWHEYGNPLFPYYNQIFHSPWAQWRDYRDPGFLPTQPGLWEALTFVWRFSFDFRQTTEVPFRDFRVLALCISLPLALLGWLWPKRQRSAQQLASMYPLLVVALAYALWLHMFRIYRYLIPLEQLSAILVVAALLMLSHRWQPKVIAALVAGLVLLTQPADWGRVAWQERAVEVYPPATVKPDTLVIMAGHEPLSFLLPAFPPSLRFVRIDSNFTNIEQQDVRFNQVMQQTVAQHSGPLAVLYAHYETADVLRKLQEYGLTFAGDCRPIATTLSYSPLYLYCSVTR